MEGRPPDHSQLLGSFKMLRAVVLQENTKEVPKEEEIEMYARSIGIRLPEEKFLLPIAQEGISAALPKGWQILQVG